MKYVRIMLFFFVLFCAAGCSGKIGYAVVLWSIPEHKLSDGDIVPVYVRSNINKVYIIGIPGENYKAEVPLWQVSEPQSKSKAHKTALRYAAYRRQYARAAIDGLPIRTEPVNTAKQVYRLRLDETIKILYKGEGQEVVAGKKALAGDWLKVLTQDGSQGWCFSYNLRIFDETDGTGGKKPHIAEKDALLEAVLTRCWVPDFYKSLVDKDTIDLERIHPEYGFDTGSRTGLIRLNTEDVHLSFPYLGTEKSGSNTYLFTGSPLTLKIRDTDSITVQYVGENGLPVSYGFISLQKSGIPQFLAARAAPAQENAGEDGVQDGSASSVFAAEADGSDNCTAAAEAVGALTAFERSRRTNRYTALITRGNSFISSNYGALTFYEDQSFTWSGFGLLVSAGVLPQSSARSPTSLGTAEIKYFISRSLERQFDGVLTFLFSNEQTEVNFLYKAEKNGLRLEHIPNGDIQKNTVSSRSSDPLVLFFANQ